MTEPTMNYIACLLVGKWPYSGAADEATRFKDLGETYVRALYDLVDRNLSKSIPWRFVCFSDRDIPGVPTRIVPKGYHGWFYKSYLFSRDAFPLGSRVLFLDLDTVPVGDLRPFLSFPAGPIVALRNVWGPQSPDHAFASGIMAWDVDGMRFGWWDRFKRFKDCTMPGLYKGRIIKTDESWFKAMLEEDGDVAAWRAWQDVCPGLAFSYKAHIMGFTAGLQERLPFTDEDARNARVIYFHGTPRPHHVNQKWNLVYHRAHGA